MESIITKKVKKSNASPKIAEPVVTKKVKKNHPSSNTIEPVITKKVKKSHPNVKPLIKEESVEKPEIKQELVDKPEKIEKTPDETIVEENENTVFPNFVRINDFNIIRKSLKINLVS